jgi:hypothetical protein
MIRRPVTYAVPAGPAGAIDAFGQVRWSVAISEVQVWLKDRSVIARGSNRWSVLGERSGTSQNGMPLIEG